MASTYEKIATTTLGSASATVTFSSIPATYTDLMLIAKTSQDGSAAATLYVRFNSDTNQNYSFTRIFGDGSTAYSGREYNATAGGVAIIGNQTIDSAGTSIVNILNYANSTTYKTCISRGSDVASTYVSAYCTLWRSTSAITNIDLKFGSTGGFVNARSGSTFTLYGILKA